MSAPAPSLRRGLTLVPTAAIVIAIVIGTGVFVKARVMTCNVGSPGAVLAVYGLAGVLTLFGALAYAELAAMMPRAGGEYNYLGAAFGRRWAFLYGWMQTFVAQGAGCAALAILFVVFLNDLVGGTLPPWALRAVPLVLLVVLVVLNLASVRASGHIATALTAVKVALVLGIGVGAFVLGDGSWGHFAQSGAAGACADVPAGARFGVAGFGAAMIGALWSYNGWQYMVGVAGEVRRPSWTLPRALVGATALIVVLYLLVNAAYFYVLSPEAVAGVSPSSSVASEVAARLFGAGVASVLAAGLMVSTFGTLYSSLLAMARVPFAMARDGSAPAAPRGPHAPHPRASQRGRPDRDAGGPLRGLGHVRHPERPVRLRHAAVPGAHRRGRVRAATDTARRRSARPHVGLPGRARALPPRRRVPPCQHPRRDAGAGHRGAGADRARAASLRNLRPPPPARRPGRLAG